MLHMFYPLLTLLIVKRFILLVTCCLFQYYSTAQSASNLNVVKAFAPGIVGASLLEGVPIILRIDGEPVQFRYQDDHSLIAKTSRFEAILRYVYQPQYDALSYQLSLKNTGTSLLRSIEYKPLVLKSTIRQDEHPRVRYLTGGYHYDAAYPSRAYQLYDYTFTTNDHAKPVTIGDDGMGSSYAYVPMMQYALKAGDKLSGFMVGFEWSGRWDIQAGWENVVYDNSNSSDFVLSGNLGLGDFVLSPDESMMFPAVHLVYFEGSSWQQLENKQKRYIADCIGHKVRGQANQPKVTYDHWFGLHSNYDIELMMKEAERAVTLGVEYFCLDAGWYGRGSFGSSNTGKWDEPDPVKFPGGISDVRRLSDYLTSKGVGFGIWHDIDARNGGGPPVDYANADDRHEALQTLRTWIKQWDLTWMRWEMTASWPENRKGIAYWNGYYEVMDALLDEFPDLVIECCFGGGKRFDLAMASRTTTTWLSDHTADPNVVRYMQTGALRFWPGYFLNMAVRVHERTGDREAYAFNVISRMPGALSFNGDIAQWSDTATQQVRDLVDAYKGVRHLQTQDSYFPLPQPRNPEDWDAVCFGDGTGEGQLLYVFRMDGAEGIYIELPGKKSGWKLVMLSGDQAKIKEEGNGYRVFLPRNAAAVWQQ